MASTAVGTLTIREKILLLFDDLPSAPVKRIAMELEKSPETIRVTLHRMKVIGLVDKLESGPWVKIPQNLTPMTTETSRLLQKALELIRMAIEIENGIQAPSPDENKKYPVGNLAIGQSFLVTGKDLPPTGFKAIRVSIWRQSKHLGFKTVVRQVEDGVRVWRIA